MDEPKFVKSSETFTEIPCPAGAPKFSSTMHHQVTTDLLTPCEDGTCIAVRLHRVGAPIKIMIHMIHSIRPAIAFGGLMLVLSLPAHALPVTTNPVDRDVVRDPYSSFSLNLSKGPVIAVPSASTFVSGAGFGSILPPAGGGFASSSSINGFLTSSMPFSFVPPPRNPQVYFSLFNPPRQSNVQIGPVQVPDRAISALLLCVSLLPLFFLRRFQFWGVKRVTD